MGAKTSKPTEVKPKTEVKTEESTVIEAAPQEEKVQTIPLSRLINTQDPTIFPESVRKKFTEYTAILQGNKQPWGVFILDGYSELLTWVSNCKSFFDVNVNSYNFNNNNNANNNNTNNTNSNNTNNKKNTYSVETDKTEFLNELIHLCGSSSIRDEFIAVVLEVSVKYFVFVMSNTGYIAGFALLGSDDKNRGCLHNYVICTGPRKLGLGKMLVQGIHTIAKQEGYSCVTLGASDALEFHKKMGYVETGEKTREGTEMIYYVPQTGGKRKRQKTRKQRKVKLNK